MAKKKAGGESKGDEWLASYADMFTVLMAFFVLLFAMSGTDNEKVDAFLKSIGVSLGSNVILVEVDADYDISDLDNFLTDAGIDVEVVGSLTGSVVEDLLTMDNLYEVMSSYVESSGASDMVTVSKRGDLVHIQFNSSILFAPDQYTMLPGSAPLLNFVGEVLKLYDEKIGFINVGGHTARTGRVGGAVSDWRLSGERAATVAMYLEENAGIDRSKLLTIGYGDNYPIADNSTEAGRAQNRRAELTIVGTENSANFDVYGMLSGGGRFADNDEAYDDESPPPLP